MAELDLGTLIAKLRLDGAADFNRDVSKAGNAFTDLADQAKAADRQINQISSPRSMQDIRRDSGQAQGSLNDLGTQGRRTSDQLRGVGDGMGQARRSIQTDTQAARRDIEGIGDSARRTSDDIRRSAGESGNAFRDELGRMQGDSEEGGDSSGIGFIAGFGSKLKGLAGKGGAWGAALAALGVVSVGAGAKLADLTMQGFEIQSERGFAQVKFGWTNDQLAQAGLAAGNAYAQTFGESIQSNINTVGIAIQTGLLNSNATAAQMQPVIEQLDTVSRLMGTEIPETAQAAGQMIKTGLATNATDAMDQLTVASQKGLNINGDLLDTMNEYSSQWQKVGIDGQTALGTISQMMQGGVRDADLAADALKEFSIRVIDGSDSTNDAFTSLGLNAEQTAAEFGKGGQAAATMADTVIDKLRGIQDPVERNRIGVELFGTQWEDVGKSIDGLDLSNARNELGNTSGAAQRAGDALASGPGASIEKIRKSLEVFVTDIKTKLADAFGPAVTDLTDKLMAHKDEIIHFFTEVVGAGLQFGVAMGNVAAGLLHVWGWTAGNLGKMFAGLVSGLGEAMSVVGGILEKIPGMGSVGNALKSTGDMAQQTGAFMAGMGDAAHGAANYIADNLVPALAGAKSSLDQAGTSSKLTSDQVATLVGKLNELPRDKPINVSAPGGQGVYDLLEHMGVAVRTDNDKNIVVESPLGPQILDLLRQLGISVRTDNNKTILVTDNNTAKTTQDNIDAIAGKTVTVNVQGNFIGKLGQILTGGSVPDPTKPDPNSSAPTYINPMSPGHAAGGQVFGPGGPRDDAFLVPLSNREWVQPVDAVDYYGNAFMADVQQRRFPRVLARGFADGGQVGGDTGYGLPAGTSISYGSGGFPDWVTKLGEEHHVKPSTYAGHQESDRAEAGYAPNPGHLNRGIDWSGSVDEMQAFAEYLVGIAPSTPTLEQVIWMNPNTGQKIGWHGRSADTDGSYFASDYGGHTDHVHMRASGPVGVAGPANGQQPQGIQDITLTAQSSREDVARKIIAEGRKRGYTDDQIADVLSMAIQESNLDPEAQNGNWKGIFQQDSSYPGRDDPNTQITGFYDRLDSKKGTPGWSQDMDQNLFWVQQAPGADSAQSAVANGRGAYMDEMNAHQDEATKMVADLGPSVGTLDTTGATTTGSGATQNVYVTGGRLDSVGSTSTPTTTSTTTTSTPTKDDPSKLKPSGPLPIVAYAEGGWGDRPDAAQMLNNANAWITLAGEAGREAFIPMDGSDRSKGLWLQAGRELGMVRAYAGGGFGGYAEDTSDWMAPKSWMDYAYLAAGAGFTAASVIGPYAQMAAAGQVTLGDLAPQPSTSSNDIPGLGEALSKAVEPLSQQLEELRKDVRDGKTVHIVVQDVKGLLEKTGIHLAAM
ncbi:phage tail tape measure protein [Gordonia polyisoprenivorans]|uniref:phage tail tape measure protein n=1 Tax=Gordonia polyisoprenivorans TaxID=84595 RepID=UPI0003A2E342|nr:phage tail tape measure protein [Gordonia polyisoprenivorans]